MAASFGTLSLADATIKDKVALQAVQVDNLSVLGLHAGSLYLRDSRVRELLDLSRATVGVLVWDAPPCDNQTQGACWPKRIFVAGLSFGELNVQPFVPPSGLAVHTTANTAPRPPESDLNLTREFLRHADFSEPLYTSYSQFLRSRGLIAAADDAQLAMHAHKRKARWHEANSLFGDLSAAMFVVIDFAQLIFLGYGQSALPPLLWALVFVLIGTAVFRSKERMEVVGDHPPRFSPFWYSLELFLPVVDLGVAKSWRPSQKSVPLLTYARIHQLAGWILIPVALATLTGVFK